MDPNMQDMMSSYLKIKKLVDDEEAEYEGDEEEEEEEDEREEDDEVVERERGVEVKFVESQLKKKKLSLGEGGSGGGGARTPAAAAAAPPLCLAENCRADLTGCKRYYQRHRVCEVHAKAPVVLLDGLRQRFCQQCSRFHEVSEFDQTKRSCRRRLAGHNERRRKSSLESQKEGPNRRLKENQCRHLNERTGNQDFDTHCN